MTVESQTAETLQLLAYKVYHENINFEPDKAVTF